MEDVQDKISIFGITALIVTAFTSVLTISINNEKAKEREYNLHILKQKQSQGSNPTDSDRLSDTALSL